MLPKIKPELFENKLFTIKGTPNYTTTVSFIDFQMSNQSGWNTVAGNSFGSLSLQNVLPPTPTISTISSNVFQKTFNLNNKIEFNVSNSTLFKLNPEDIKKIITNKFIEKITELGKYNRESNIENQKYNISITKLKKEVKESYTIARKIISKILMSGNNIAMNGRIGPAQYLISNSKTYDYIMNYLTHIEIIYDNNNVKIGNMIYYVDDAVQDDVIVFGRKNKIEQTGVHCLILTDDEGYVQYQQINNPYSLSTKFVLFYEIIDVGFTPEKQYMTIDTRDISYKRFKKLERIKEIYG